MEDVNGVCARAMSRQIILCGTGPEVTVRFSPPIDCSDVPYELAFVDLQTTNTVINVREGRNTVIYKAGEADACAVSVPEGTYNVDGINDFLYNFLSRQFEEKFKSGEYFFDLKADTSTHRCSISTSFKIFFGEKEGETGPTLGSALGFTSNTVEPTANKNAYTPAEGTFSLLEDFNVFVTCNVIESGYVNTRVSHNIYQFHIEVQPGVIVEESAAHLVFYRVTHRCIDDITLRLENEKGELIALKDDTKLRVHLVLRERRYGNAC